MSEVTKVCNPSITITVQEQTPIVVETKNEVTLPVVEVQVPGIQGPAAVEKPLEIDPLETYLQARGEFNGNNP